MARPGRLELPTLCLEGRRSIQLSYGRNYLIVRYLFACAQYFWVITLCSDGRRSFPTLVRTVVKVRLARSLERVGIALI